jgi:hypothetical protein
MSELLVKKLRAAQEHAILGEVHLADAGLYGMAADEIEHLRSLLGAVTPGQSVADIKEHLRSFKKDKPDGSRESAAS